jgi:hypothetical protein
VGADDSLTPVRQASYLTEDDLQTLLERYPSLLDGELLNQAAPRRWVLVQREAGLADAESGTDRWFMDHLFLDQDGIPTIVEVKRSSDTRIRREVVGQMLDYAANAVVYLPVEKLRAWFEERCGQEGREPGEVLSTAFGQDVDPDAYWDTVKTNLQAEKLRLVFVADEIPSELRRVIEFLNGQMRLVEIVGIELPQYVSGDSTGKLRTLVPRIVGRTAEAERSKGTRSSMPGRDWDEASFLAEVGPDETKIARDILTWAPKAGLTAVFGHGATYGTLNVTLLASGARYPFFSQLTTGKIELDFAALQGQPAFADIEVRRELATRISTALGVEIPASRLGGYPKLATSALFPDAARRAFFDAIEWAADLACT